MPPNRGLWLGSRGSFLGWVRDAPTFREKPETGKSLGSGGETLAFGEEQMPAEVLGASLHHHFVASVFVSPSPTPPHEFLPRKRGGILPVPKESPLGPIF